MDPPRPTAGDTPSPTRKQLQGPRPTQLRVSKDSHSIRKPPLARQNPRAAAHGGASKNPPPHTAARETDRQPVIIYAVSPKVIHATADDFMSVVQRLTGSYSDPVDVYSGGGGGDVSPAARLATTERTSPKEREGFMLVDDEVPMGRFPGILSPAPGALPPVSPGLFFSPGTDAYGLRDLSSPAAYGSGYQNIFMTSPSNLFTAPLVSPSGFDPFNPQFFF